MATFQDVRDRLEGKFTDCGHRRYAIPLLDAIEARAKLDDAYRQIVEDWLDVDHPASTVVFRDEIVAPFKADPEVIREALDHFYPFTDCWMSLDSAAHGVHWTERQIAHLNKQCAADRPWTIGPRGILMSADEEFGGMVDQHVEMQDGKLVHGKWFVIFGDGAPEGLEFEDLGNRDEAMDVLMKAVKLKLDATNDLSPM